MSNNRNFEDDLMKVVGDIMNGYVIDYDYDFDKAYLLIDTETGRVTVGGETEIDNVSHRIVFYPLDGLLRVKPVERFWTLEDNPYCSIATREKKQFSQKGLAALNTILNERGVAADIRLHFDDLSYNEEDFYDAGYYD